MNMIWVLNETSLELMLPFLKGDRVITEEKNAIANSFKGYLKSIKPR